MADTDVDAAPMFPDTPVVGERIVLAQIGVGVPAHQAGLIASAIAAEAQRCGYRAVVVETDHVSALVPNTFGPSRAPSPCLGCGRSIGRYPSGRHYSHDCNPAGQRWVIDLPYQTPPLSLNKRMHRMDAAKWTAQLRSDAWKLAKHHKIPRCEQVRVTLHWQPATRRPRDSDNPMSTLKALCDGLVDARVVVDDTHDRMTKRVEIHDPVAGEPGKLWLTIEALEAGR